jgi:serine/threonine protein kinase
MEFCGCGSVSDLIKHLKKDNALMTSDQIWGILVQVMKGLIYLHAHGILYDIIMTPIDIIHRDLKPANILLNSAGQAKLADFGVSAQLNQSQKASTTVGTRTLFSPHFLTMFFYSPLYVS